MLVKIIRKVLFCISLVLGLLVGVRMHQIIINSVGLYTWVTFIVLTMLSVVLCVVTYDRTKK